MGRDILSNNIAHDDLLPNKLIIKHDLFGLSMKHGINHHIKNTNIVTKQLWKLRDKHSDVPKKIGDPLLI